MAFQYQYYIEIPFWSAVPVAQWIARRTSNPEAVGSSPTGDVYAFKSTYYMMM